MKRVVVCSVAGFMLAGSCAAFADVVPHPLFADHAVLQQGRAIPVWGTASPGESVTVEVMGSKVSTRAGADGKWMVTLGAMTAGGPFTMTISGKNTVALRDILVGEVWIASGQSNMERQLGLRPGQQPIVNYQKEVASANYPAIRHFGVEQTKSLAPLATVKGEWKVCSPKTVEDFTAVGYFFARDVHRARKIPVGIVHSSWGGTPVQAWTSETGLKTLPEFADVTADLKRLSLDPAAAKRAYEDKLESWFAAVDPGSAPGKSLSGAAVDDQAWKSVPVPGLWENAGEPDLNGVVWMRREFDLAESAGAAELHLGMVDDVDTTWVNGVKLGTTPGYNAVRTYPIPAGVLKKGRNVVAVRVLDTGGGGGIWGDKHPVVAFPSQASRPPIDLAGPWRYHVGVRLEAVPAPPSAMTGDPGTPTVLWNGMIAPLVPYALCGVIWYQGESNAHEAGKYRTWFPAMIADWRRAFGQGDFPFLFVQIAPFQEIKPDIRQAQLQTVLATPNTAMAVTLDVGDAKDIHPARKAPVGARLALAARALAYGEHLEYSGPLFDSIRIEGNKANLSFTHTYGGLRAKSGPLKGFTVAGADGVFIPATAKVRGDRIEVSTPKVKVPVAVRYGWANVPDANLINGAGLPASPFRTDTE